MLLVKDQIFLIVNQFINNNSNNHYDLARDYTNRRKKQKNFYKIKLNIIFSILY